MILRHESHQLIKNLQVSNATEMNQVTGAAENCEIGLTLLKRAKSAVNFLTSEKIIPLNQDPFHYLASVNRLLP